MYLYSPEISSMFIINIKSLVFIATYKEGIITIPIFQNRKLRSSMFSSLEQDSTVVIFRAGTRTCHLALECMILTTVLCYHSNFNENVKVFWFFSSVYVFHISVIYVIVIFKSLSTNSFISITYGFVSFFVVVVIIITFLAVLGLRFCERALSSCGKQGPLFTAVHGPLTVVASPVEEHRLQTRRLSSCGPPAQLPRGMWDPPRPGLEPASPALAGRLSTTAPPEKPYGFVSIDWYLSFSWIGFLACLVILAWRLDIINFMLVLGSLYICVCVCVCVFVLVRVFQRTYYM